MVFYGVGVYGCCASIVDAIGIERLVGRFVRAGSEV